MPLQATSGAASYDAFGGGAAAVPQYIEDVFSTYLYTGDGSTQTITNGIDLSTKGGLVWIKRRDSTSSNAIVDTARGSTKVVFTNTTAAEVTSGSTNDLTSFNTTGFSLGTNQNASVNTSAATYASWTFRKQPKFFDIVTYTGNGFGARDVAHNLGSVPGFILIKRTDSTSNWGVWHRGDGVSAVTYFSLNSTSSGSTDVSYTDFATSTTFVVDGIGPTSGPLNVDGGTYIAYLFAHNAGGFGLTGTDNVISCGTFTTDTNGDATVNLGYEPQWVMTKVVSDISNWVINDNMRGMPASQTTQYLRANTSNAETTSIYFSTQPTPTGFKTNSYNNTPSLTMIYIAIRRPMKVPTSGTSVFGLSARTGTGADATVTGGQTDDAVLIKNRGSAVGDLFASRLTGTGYLETSATTAEVAAGTTILQANPWDVMDGVKVGTTSTITNASSNTFINYLFKRAPSFFDVVCYTGNSATNAQSHNLQTIPELVICKSRNAADDWIVLNTFTASTFSYMFLNYTDGQGATSYGSTDQLTTKPTSTTISFGNQGSVNSSGTTYVAYLFATCAGVSKVGSYTGTATTKQIDCGFTGGARFVLIKRTDDSGAWYVWDTARGIVSGNDQYFLFNTTAAEVTNTDYIDTYSAGFEISSTAPAAINANGGTYIFLAIA